MILKRGLIQCIKEYFILLITQYFDGVASRGSVFMPLETWVKQYLYGSIPVSLRIVDTPSCCISGFSKIMRLCASPAQQHCKKETMYCKSDNSVVFYRYKIFPTLKPTLSTKIEWMACLRSCLNQFGHQKTKKAIFVMAASHKLNIR
jgi:hypothetical protein